MVSEAKEGFDWRLSCLGKFGALLELTQILTRRAHLSEDKESACFRSSGVTTGRQGAGDITGRERCEDSASV